MAISLDTPMTQPRRPSWHTAKHLLSTFDGAASELFVIDLPAEHWDHVVSRLAQLPDLEVLTFGGEDLERQVFDSTWRERILASGQDDSQIALRSSNGSSRHLQIYLWPASESNPVFDIEFVFWNDTTFSCRVAEAERDRRLGRLVDLAEDCRVGAADAQCILSTEHNGDPRELLIGGAGLVW